MPLAPEATRAQGGSTEPGGWPGTYIPIHASACTVGVEYVIETFAPSGTADADSDRLGVGGAGAGVPVAGRVGAEGWTAPGAGDGFAGDGYLGDGFAGDGNSGRPGWMRLAPGVGDGLLVPAGRVLPERPPGRTCLG